MHDSGVDVFLGGEGCMLVTLSCVSGGEEFQSVLRWT